ncbi:MAG: ankyrin repeat domain-containing protein, partial [Cyanobacteria bacterium J06607_10]
MEDFKFQRKELFDAVEQSNVRQVRRLLSLKVSPHCLNAYGQTPLDVATPIGHPEVIRLLRFAIATTPRPQPLFIGSDFASSPQSAINSLLGDGITPVSGPAAALTQSLPAIYSLLSQPQTPPAPSVDYAELVTKALQSSKPTAAPAPAQTADEVIDRTVKASVTASEIAAPNATASTVTTMPEVTTSQAPVLQPSASKVTTSKATTPTTRKSIVISMEPEAGFVAESDNAAIAPVATDMPVDTVPVDMETL